MKKNMGTVDKGVRILAAVIIALLYYFDIIEGTVAYKIWNVEVVPIQS